MIHLISLIITGIFFNSRNGRYIYGGIVGPLFGCSIVRSSWKTRGILDKKERKISLNYVPQFSSQFTGLKIIANIE
jgi:hypothetical protein